MPLLSDDELFGPATADAPAIPTAAKPPRMLSDEELFAGGIDRSHFKSEIDANPALVNRMASMVSGEVGLQQDPVRERIQLESAFNRAHARGHSLEQALLSVADDPQRGYYARDTYRRQPSPQEMDYFKTNVLDPVLSGSDEGTKFLGSPVTGNASQLGFAGRRLASGTYANGKWYGAPGGSEMFVTEKADADRLRRSPLPSFISSAEAGGGRLLSDEELFGGTPPVTQEPATPATSSPVPPVTPPTQTVEGGGFGAAFMKTALEGNPEDLASGLEAFSDLPGGHVVQPLADKLHDLSKSNAGDYETKAKSIWDTENWDERWLWARETAGSALASSLPSMIGGAAGAAAGAVTPLPLGTAGGAVAGAFTPSLLANAGQVRSELIKAGIDPTAANQAARIAAVPMAALDVVEVGQVANALGVKEVKREVARHIARRLLETAGKISLTEGTTEFAQEGIQMATLSAKTGQPFLTKENLLRGAEAGLGGAIGGAMFGAAASVPRDRVAGTPVTDTDVVELHRDLMARETPAGAPAPEAIAVAMSASPKPGPVAPFYSALRQTVEDKKFPNNASPTDVRNFFRGKVKEEELVDTGLDDWLEKQGKVSKEDLLGYLDENAVTVETKFISPRPVAPASGAFPGWEQAGENNPYEQYQTPGPNQGYMEMLLKLPPRGIMSEIGFEGAHFKGEEDVVGWGRMTIRNDLDNIKTLHLEEIQSDIHQAGAKHGYVDEKYEIATRKKLEELQKEYRALLAPAPSLAKPGAPGYEFVQKAGIAMPDLDFVRQNVPRFSEVEQELHEVNQAIKYIEAQAPNAPFKDTWQELVIKRAIRTAADMGISRISLTPGLEQIRRYPKAEQRIKSGLLNSYDYLLPSKMKKIIKGLRGGYGKTKISTFGSPEMVIRQANGQEVRIPAGDTATAFMQDNPGSVVLRADRAGIAEEVFYIDLPPNAAEKVRDEGQKLYSKVPPGWQEITNPRPEGYEFDTTLPVEQRRSLIKTRIGQIVRDRRGEKVDGQYPNNVELTRLRAELKAIEKGDIVSSVDAGGQFILMGRQELRSDPLWEAGERAAKAIYEVARKMGMKDKVRFQLVREPEGYGYTTRKPDAGGRRTITLNLAGHTEPIHLLGTAAHEFGHVIKRVLFENAPSVMKDSIIAAYTSWRAEFSGRSNFADVMMRRDAIIGPRTQKAAMGEWPDTNINEAQMGGVAYWLSMDEWFAEQTARWMSTAEKPLSIVDKFFDKIGKTIKRMLKIASQKFGLNFEPDAAVKDFLDAQFGQPLHIEAIAQERQQDTLRENQRALDHDQPETPAAPRQPEITPIAQGINNLFQGNPPPQIAEHIAQADRFNWLYKWGLSLIQVAKRNIHIGELQAYRETVHQMHLDTQKVMVLAHGVLKQLRDLGNKQETAVYAVMDELDRMTYRTEDEARLNRTRNPTREEVETIARRHGLTTEGKTILQSMMAAFDKFLTINERLAMEKAAKRLENDPVNLAKTLDEIRSHFAELRRKPYFPHMQFGEHTVTVTDKRGQIVHLESVERHGFKSAEKVQEERKRALLKKYPPEDFNIQLAKWKKDVQPLIGMPRTLIDLLTDEVELTEQQRDALEQLRWTAEPHTRFPRKFLKNTPGYSLDFRRAFANYFFFGAHFFAKARHASTLRGHMRALDATTKAVDVNGNLLYPNVNKRREIYNFLQDHFHNTMNPKNEWTFLRSITFITALGFMPASAAINLTQLPLATYPFLGAHFGDAKAIAAITRAGTNIKTYYKRGKLEALPQEDFQALDEAIKEAVLTEAMAPELAGATQANNLFYGIAGNAPQRTWQFISEKAMFLFEMAEQVNRRVTFRAAWRLALDNPNAKYIDEVVRANPEQLKRLTDPISHGGRGWTERQARAFIAAKDTVEQTQFVYAGVLGRPRFMRGKASTVLMFKLFAQNTLFMMVNYPSVALRSMLMMGFLGGLMGLPGGDDLKELLRVFAYQLFGKDFDLEKETRKWILQMTDGTVPPDLILHGMARRGFGIPLAMDAIGAAVGYNSLDQAFERFRTGRTRAEAGGPPLPQHVPTPTIDMSRSIGLGNILPVRLGEVLGPPNKDQSKVMVDEMQRASGAAFGAWFNIYKALTDYQTSPTEFKRWERALPRAIQSVSQAYRWGSEGRETGRTGVPVQNYNVHDTEQMGELIARAAGFQPLARTAQWDRITAEREALEFIDINRETLMRQFHHALQTHDEESVAKVRGAIKEFNQGLPESSKGKVITSEALHRSLQSRGRDIQLRERGLPTQKTAVGTTRSIQELFPESTIDVRQIR